MTLRLDFIREDIILSVLNNEYYLRIEKTVILSTIHHSNRIHHELSDQRDIFGRAATIFEAGYLATTLLVYLMLSSIRCPMPWIHSVSIEWKVCITEQLTPYCMK